MGNAVSPPNDDFANRLSMWNREALVIPAGCLEVRLSIYQLNIIGAGVVNSVGAFLLGVYHSAVVIGPDEWAYGGHSEEMKSGVYKITPESDPQHLFYQRIPMGRIIGSIDEARAIVTDFALQPRWRGTSYDLLERNCNHFTSELLWLLLRRRPPTWINATADEMARKGRRHRVEQIALHEAVEEYIQKYDPADDGKFSRRIHVRDAAKEQGQRGSQSPVTDVRLSAVALRLSVMADSPPTPEQEGLQSPHEGKGKAVCDLSDEEAAGLSPAGLRAFVEEFKVVFELIWETRWEQGQKAIFNCKLDADPEKMRSELEADALARAATMAGTCATIVGTAARCGILSRREISFEGYDVWDVAWSEATSELVKEWRAAALMGQLDLDDRGAAARQVQVDDAVAFAEKAVRDSIVTRSSATCGTARTAAAACGTVGRTCC